MIDTWDIELPHGIRLSCRSAGDAGHPTLVFLHGFPEAAFAWDEVMGRLSARFRCVAPNLRGYERSSAPGEVAAYHPRELVADVVALIERLGAPIATLVAHDWGGAIAWNLAAQRPDLMHRLVIVNSPHPVTFVRELSTSPAQQAASAYMTELVRPDAEARLSADDHAGLVAFLTGAWQDDATPPGAQWLDDTTLARYRDVWRQGLTGPLNYYRASPLRPPTPEDGSIRALRLPPDFGRVEVPTLVLWGERDRALLPSLLDGLERHVPNLRIERFPDGTHWLVHERPDRVADLIAAFSLGLF